MKVCAITATCGRHTCIERSVRLFLDQDYKDKMMLIFNNSTIPQILDNTVPDNVKLINCSFNAETGNPYNNLGEIYRDAVKFVPSDCNVVTFWDDDDIFLSNHLSEGIKGYKEARELGKLAYKPRKSYYKYMTDKTQLVSNTMEPSVFVQKDHILKYGFSNTTTEQHLQWYVPLGKDDLIYIKEEGIPTMIYNWSDNFPTFKTSGDSTNKENFNNYRNFSQDHGDMIITPIEIFDLSKYFINA